MKSIIVDPKSLPGKVEHQLDQEGVAGRAGARPSRALTDTTKKS